MSTALVTGASSGIGLAFVRQLAERGHDVVLVARDRARLENLADDVERTYRVRAEILAADLTDRDQLGRVAARLGEAERPVDLLVNNAGHGLAKGFLAGDVADEERLLEIHCRATLVLSHAAARAMVQRGHGAIVNVSSVASFVAMGSYSAAKAWVTTFSEGLSTELAPHGVTVTALCPGFTHTEFHERARMDMSRLPEALWLDADELVRAGLADVARGRAISVPGAAYKAVVGVTRLLPRALTRQVSGGISRRRRRG
ncbi:MAG TPA: SDR family oxidoreductase [Dermatophilaceae bacterium]|nr:SDR family oxidoreductase [Dermatophilaceae bacterium]